MSKRAAIELSANFLVVLILGIVVLSMGIYLAFTMFQKAEYEMSILDSRAKQQIEELLDDPANLVAALLNSAKAYPKDILEFRIGVRNIEYGSNFAVVIDKDIEIAGCDSNSIKILYPNAATHPIKIETNEKGILGAAVKVPATAKKGCEYVLNAWVYRCPEAEPYCQEPSITYGVMEKLYVSVI